MVEQQPRVFGSWTPTERGRAQLSRNNRYLILILDGKLYSLDVDLLLELIAGHRENLRIFKFLAREEGS
jgi:hypothetical protein